MSRAKSFESPPQDVERPLLQDGDDAFDELEARPGSAGSVLAQLLGARERGRLAHALLLAGPAGSGKRWVATRLAQALACPSPEGGGPCLRCPDCLLTEKGMDTDVLLLEPPWDERKGERKGEIPVERVRKAQELLGFRSAGRRRVVLIDPADRLSLVGQEALLKTLEEPPAGVTLLLLSSRPSFLKPTIRSRAPLLRVLSPPPAALGSLLARRKGLEPEAAELAARLSSGHVREALALDAADVAERWVGLARTLYQVLGASGESLARDLALETAPSKGEEGGGREDVAAFLSLLQRILRDAMVMGSLEPHDAVSLVDHEAARDPDSLLVHPGAAKAARGLAARLPPDAAARALASVDAARDHLALNVSAKVVLTALLMSLHGLRTA